MTDTLTEQPVAERPRITFALFAYNQEKYIREAVESAFAQTYEPLTIILSDDSSTDATYQIMSDLVENYKGQHLVKLLRNNINIGLINHINKVFSSLTDSDLIVVQAGDDISLPERTTLLWQAWESGSRKPKIVSSGMSYINMFGDEVGKIIPHEAGLKNDQTFQITLNPNGRLYGASAMYHKDIYHVFGPLNAAKVEDGPLSIRSQLLGPSIALKNKLVKKRITDSNMSGYGNRDYKKYTVKANEWRISIYKQVLQDLNSKNFRTLDVFREYDFFEQECKKRIQIHCKTLRLIKDRYFVTRLSLWLALLPRIHFTQSIDNFIYIFPSMVYEKLYLFGRPTDSKLWKKLLKFKQTLR